MFDVKGLEEIGRVGKRFACVDVPAGRISFRRMTQSVDRRQAVAYSSKPADRGPPAANLGGRREDADQFDDGTTAIHRQCYGRSGL